MKKFISAVRKFISIAYKIIPLFIGLYCYYPFYSDSDDHMFPFLDTLYSSIKLYSGTVEGGIPLSAPIEIARFMALIASLSVLLHLFNKVNDVVDRFKLINSESTIVYGDSVYADYIYKRLKKRSAIRGSDRFVKSASRYLIMFSDDIRSLEFYDLHYSELKDKRVYIMLENISRQNIENPLVSVFSVSENCARQYWREYPSEASEKIAIIGFDNVGRNILLYGL